jgi:hypothetical protein
MPPSPGDFQICHILNNLTILDGGASLKALQSTHPSVSAAHTVHAPHSSLCALFSPMTLHRVSCRSLFAWYNAMMELPAVAAYVAARPQPGSADVGRPGSLIFKYKVPNARA